MTLVKIGIESRILLLDGLFQILFGGIFLPPVKIFSGNWCVVCSVSNGFCQGMKWSRCAFFKNSIWRTAAMHHIYCMKIMKNVSICEAIGHLMIMAKKCQNFIISIVAAYKLFTITN